LIVPTEGLTDAQHDAIINLVNSTAGQDANEFAEVMARTNFPDGSIMLANLHVNGKLIKVPTGQIEMTPNTQMKILLSELNQIIGLILQYGIVIWCCNDYVYISSVKNYLEWIKEGGCISPTNPDFCFTVSGQKFIYSCNRSPMGVYGGKTFYNIKDGTCITSINYYVYWSPTNNRWEFGDEPIGGTTIFSYLNNPGIDPISDMTYNWAQISPTQIYSMISSPIGNCVK
jgi:hypothetical protein